LRPELQLCHYVRMKSPAHPDHLPPLLQAAGLRPTAQRMALARVLFDGCHKHMTAEQVHAAVRKSRTRVSLATVYNTLHRFTAAGFLRQVVIDSNRVYFDTNTASHYHFFDPATGALHDIAANEVRIAKLPKPPKGRKIEGIGVIVRLR
jgi:Fur family iron response transcriptional regulator